jgi:hypothetical protein
MIASGQVLKCSENEGLLLGVPSVGLYGCAVIGPILFTNGIEVFVRHRSAPVEYEHYSCKNRGP